MSWILWLRNCESSTLPNPTRENHSSRARVEGCGSFSRISGGMASSVPHKRPFDQFLKPFNVGRIRENSVFLIEELSVREVAPDPENNKTSADAKQDRYYQNRHAKVIAAKSAWKRSPVTPCGSFSRISGGIASSVPHRVIRRAVNLNTCQVP